MVSKFLKMLNRDVTTMNKAALVLAVFSFLSQIFGLFRDRLLASLIGPSANLDVYYAAFRIPDFIYNSVAVLFSVTAVIPFITQYLKEDEETRGASLKKFFDNIFSIYLLGMMFVSLICFVLMPYLTKITAPGFNGTQQQQLVLFSRIMLLSPFFLGLSNLLGSFAQVKKKFFSFAIAPLFYNLGILTGILVLMPYLGMLGIVLGVILGAMLHLTIQIPTLMSLQKLPSFIKKIDWATISKVIKLSLPRTLASSLSNITLLMISAVASLLVAGSISVFQFSYNIQTTPLMIIGISYAVAAFPSLNKLFIDKKHEDFLELVHRATRNIFFLSIPASLFFIVLRAQVVRVLLGAGAFSWNDTRLVAASLAFFSISITAQCMVLLLIRAFYAMEDTKTPLKINAGSVLITFSSALILLLCYKESESFRTFLESLMRIEGTRGSSVILLSLSFSIGQIVNACLLWRKLHKGKGRPNKIKDLNKALFHTIGASIIAATCVYATLIVLSGYINQETFWGILTQGVISGLVGIAVYALILKALKNEDIKSFLDTAKSKFWKQKIPPVIPNSNEITQ